MQQLEASEERFRLLADHAPLIVWETDAGGACTYLNRRWAEFTGQPTATGLLAGWLACVHPDDRAALEAAPAGPPAGAESRRRELRLRRHDGAYRWMIDTAAPRFEDDGTFAGQVGSMVDITERREAESAAREHAQRLNLAMSAARLGDWSWDAATDELSGSARAAEILGAPPGTRYTRTALRARVPPEDGARVRAEIATALSARREFDVQFPIQRADDCVWVAVRGQGVFDAAGEAKGMVGVVQDITAWKKADEELRTREERFRELASHAPVGIFLGDVRGHGRFVNEKWCELAGLTPDQALGLGWLHAVHPDDRTRVMTEWTASVAEARPFALEYRFLRRDGRVLWLQGGAVDFHDEAGACRLGTVVDITERKAAEFALRESEKRFRLLANRAPVGIFMTDPHGDTVFVNDAWCRLAGMTAADAQGSGWRQAVHPDDRGRVQEDWREAVSGAQGSTAEFRFRRPDGSIAWVQGSAVQLRDAGGRLAGYVGTVADFTPRKEAEAELWRAQAQLQAHADELEKGIAERTASLREAIAQMEEFSYSVSHDLRSPLRAMNAYAQALVEDYGAQLDDTARTYLQRIQRSSARMEQLTHDVLTYSRLARSDVELAPVDLESMLRELVEHYAELQPPAATVEVRTPLLPVRGHKSSLSQALGNLLTNAAKFVAPGEVPRIEVFTARHGERVRISVRDHGIGIPPQYHAALFRVFERVPNRARYEGTGIGLAIVRKAAEKMGGRCGVESDGRRGSLFWIELPPA